MGKYDRRAWIRKTREWGPVLSLPLRAKLYRMLKRGLVSDSSSFERFCLEAGLKCEIRPGCDCCGGWYAEIHDDHGHWLTLHNFRDLWV